jgi:iron(III) transport system substrate-binding protein
MITFRALFLACLMPGLAMAQGTRLSVHSATDTSAIAGLVARFEMANPGVVVDYREYNTAELHRAALQASAGEMDVVISSAMDLQVDLVNRGLAQAFRPAGADTLPEWAKWRDELYGFTFEPVLMAYNRAAFANRPLPRTRSDLASQIRDDPGFYDDRIGTYDIAISGVGYLFASQDARRGSQFSRLVESLGRAKARRFCCTSLVMEGVAKGALVFGYNVIGSYAINAATVDPRIGVYMLEDYNLVMTRTALVAKNSRNKDAARAFVAFLLSSEGQRILAQEGSLVPIGAFDAAAGPLAQVTRGKPLFPIRLGPGLLTYLDVLKAQRFQADWRASFVPADDQTP